MYRSDAPTSLDANSLRVGIVVSEYHHDITSALCDGARQTFLDAGGVSSNLTIIAAPGSFELVSIATRLADTMDAVVTLGCIITGDTTHDQYIGHAVAQGIAQISVLTGVPVGFGVLTCQTIDQARARAGGDKGNKGAETMAATIQTATVLRSLAAQEEGITDVSAS
ncbi:MAG: 6,7-dimethyl-8-ribityllumazine synthase [Planctomycetota bacterium]